MHNEIAQVRLQLERDFDPSRLVADEHETHVSPCGRYRLEVDFYATELHPDYSDLIVTTVHDHVTGATLATLKRNDGNWFHGWVVGGARDYLVCSEDLAGQTVVDLHTGDIAGFAPAEAGLMWFEYWPSPSQQRLAVIGCQWACPYMVTVYDFRAPMDLPLPILSEQILSRADDAFGKWLGDDQFTLKHVDGTETTLAAVA